MLSHGTAPAGLLVSTMVLKNKCRDKWDSNNYSVIAISSLLGLIQLKIQHASLFTSYCNMFLNNSFTVICTSFHERLWSITKNTAVTVTYHF